MSKASYNNSFLYSNTLFNKEKNKKGKKFKQYTCLRLARQSEMINHNKEMNTHAVALTPSVLEYIFTTSFSKIRWFYGRVYGGQKINGQSLHYSNSHQSFWSCIKLQTIIIMSVNMHHNTEETKCTHEYKPKQQLHYRIGATCSFLSSTHILHWKLQITGK